MKKFSLLFFTVIVCFFVPSVASADEMPYAVKAMIPSNQIDKEKTYFDLLLQPNEEQDISLMLTNSSTENITINVEPHNASTSNNGVIEYNKGDKQVDKSLQYPITSMLSEKQQVTLLPNENKEITFHLKMPNETFAGISLGGFYIYKEDQKNSASQDKNIQINNKFAYVIGIQVRQNLDEVAKNMNLLKAEAGLRNHRTVIYATLQNDQAVLINDLEITAKILKKNSSKILYEQNEKNLSVAPNSSFHFPVSLENQPIRAGEYTLEVDMRSGKDVWKKKQDFTIETSKAKELNKDAVEIEKKEVNWNILLIVFMGIIILTLLILLWLSNKKKRNP